MPQKSQQATAAELREFLAQMRGKSPKEMLGAIASSNLFQSTLTASAAITTAIVALTLVPFGLDKLFGDRSAAPPQVAEAPTAKDPDKPLESPPGPGPDDTSPRSPAEKLGVGESKDAPPNINPLESSTDDLLKGLE